MNQRSNYHRSAGRSAFTLIELLASMAAASVLMVGLSSALYIAVQAVDVSNSTSAAVVEGCGTLADMHADLQYAVTISEKTVNSITAIIPDRDDPDTSADTIRYAWGGTAGDPLTRQYNGGAVVVVVPSVHGLSLKYSHSPTATIESVAVQLQMNVNFDSLIVSRMEFVNRP